MLLQTIGWLQLIADIIAIIIGFLQPFLLPLGEWTKGWIEYLLQFFPTDSHIIYYIIGGIIVTFAIIINCKWPGDRL